jgi:hypothetical protein
MAVVMMAAPDGSSDDSSCSDGNDDSSCSSGSNGDIDGGSGGDGNSHSGNGNNNSGCGGNRNSNGDSDGGSGCGSGGDGDSNGSGNNGTTIIYKKAAMVAMAATAVMAAADEDLMEASRGVLPPQICGGNR